MKILKNTMVDEMRIKVRKNNFFKLLLWDLKLCWRTS